MTDELRTRIAELEREVAELKERAEAAERTLRNQINYSIFLQRGIESVFHKDEIREELFAECPHHAEMVKAIIAREQAAESALSAERAEHAKARETLRNVRDFMESQHWHFHSDQRGLLAAAVYAALQPPTAPVAAKE